MKAWLSKRRGEREESQPEKKKKKTTIAAAAASASASTSKFSEQHRKLERDYYLKGRGRGRGSSSSKPADSESNKCLKTDLDVAKETYRFIRSDEDDEKLGHYERKLARKYYDKLYRSIVLVKFDERTGKVGMRWRSEKEVLAGKGDVTCGDTSCKKSGDLQTFEVNFGYVENREKKNALVKVKLCRACAPMLQSSSSSSSKKKKRKHSGGDGAATNSGGASNKKVST